MDDLSRKLADMLNDPDTLNQVRQMAESILGEEKKEENAPKAPDISDIFGGVDISSLISIISRLKSSENDDRTKLLYALKPHLSEPRREKVDTAIKILKAIELLPLLKDSGILNF